MFDCRVPGSQSEPPLSDLRSAKLALMLATKTGTFVMAEMLEELPSGHALAELPDALLDKLATRLKVQAKIQELTKK